MFDESKVCGLIKDRDLVGAFRYYDSLSDDDYTPDAMVLFAILNVASKEYMNGEKFTILDVSDEPEAWRMHFHSISLTSMVSPLLILRMKMLTLLISG